MSRMTWRVLALSIFATVAACGLDDDTARPVASADPIVEAPAVQPGASLNVAVEAELLGLINGHRGDSGDGLLERDPGHDYLIDVYTQGLAADQTLGGREAEQLAQEHAGWDRLLCAEVTQWWGGGASAQVHYDALLGAGAGSQLFDPADRFIGLSIVEGLGPAGSQFEERNGSYLGILICNHPFRLITDPAAD